MTSARPGQEAGQCEALDADAQRPGPGLGSHSTQGLSCPRGESPFSSGVIGSAGTTNNKQIFKSHVSFPSVLKKSTTDITRLECLKNLQHSVDL